MINANIKTELNGDVFRAFETYCANNGCSTASEGIRSLIRETSEFKSLRGDNDPSVGENKQDTEGRQASQEEKPENPEKREDEAA